MPARFAQKTTAFPNQYLERREAPAIRHQVRPCGLRPNPKMDALALSLQKYKDNCIAWIFSVILCMQKLTYFYSLKERNVVYRIENLFKKWQSIKLFFRCQGSVSACRNFPTPVQPCG